MFFGIYLFVVSKTRLAVVLTTARVDCGLTLQATA